MYIVFAFLHTLFLSLFQNRFYVETKLKTDLNDELRKLFRLHVLDHHIELLLSKYLSV